MVYLLTVLFLGGYLCIFLEKPFRLHRAAAVLVAASLSWIIYLTLTTHPPDQAKAALFDQMEKGAEIFFFLMGCMTLVELVHAHNGFQSITDLLFVSSKRTLMWLLGLFTFFLSALLDNVTTTLIMIAFLRCLPLSRKEKVLLGSLVIIAANAGGAWTPIGDTTTTMLWINGSVTTLPTIQALFFPSLTALVVPLLWMGQFFKGPLPQLRSKLPVAKGAHRLLILSVLGIVCVPVLHALLAIPPCVSIFLILGIVWIVADRLHLQHPSQKNLSFAHVLSHVDVPGLFFLLGILLLVGALSAAELLTNMSLWLLDIARSNWLLASVIGSASAFLGGVPVVAAIMAMFSGTIYQDTPFWHLTAYAAGTGGSICIIGSAAGIVWMGIEKIDFMTYLKIAALPALGGFFAGLGVYWLQGLFC